MSGERSARAPAPSAELRDAVRVRAALRGDRRLADVVDRALFAVAERRDEAWVSSHGSVASAHVTVLVDGETLAHLEASPALEGALFEVVAAAAPGALDASVTELHVAWGVAEAHAQTYREAAPRPIRRDDPEALRLGLAAYLRASGDATTADTILTRGVRLLGTSVAVEGVAPSAIERGVRALRAGAARGS